MCIGCMDMSLPNSDMLSFELFGMCLKRFFMWICLPGLCARFREDVE